MSRIEDKLFKLKIRKSKQILMKEIKSQRSQIAILWTAGRDGACLLHLIRQVFEKITFPVLFPDTGFHFKETYEYRDKIAEAFELHLTNVKPTKSYHEADNRELCCYRLRAEPILRAMKKQKFKTLISPLRWSGQKTFPEGHALEMSITTSPLSFRTIKPIAHWAEKDILRYIEEKKIPSNSLYDKGYRSVLCKMCKFGQLDEKKLSDKNGTGNIIKRLESLGYF